MSFEREEPNYYGAGPALLPTDVLQQAALDLINYQNLGLGVGEISHRSKQAVSIVDETKVNLTRLLAIPDTHEVFFMQGGGTSGFSSSAANLMAAYAKRTGKKGKAAYAVTGTWSKKAYEEALRLGFEAEAVVDVKKQNGKFGDIPPTSEWKPVNSDYAYLYYCDNETVNGIEFQQVPEAYAAGVEIVADMSSNFLSRKIDVSQYGLILAGAQKNVGLAGLSIYIIKKNLLEQAGDEELKQLGVPLSPIAFHYPTVVQNNSAYNTIPIFTLHIINLVLKKLLAQGGLAVQEATNGRKAAALYSVLDSYPQLFKLPVATGVRSKMNIVFTIEGEGNEDEFLKLSGARGLTGLKGHRSVGGMRASLYNAVTEKSVQSLVDFTKEFAESRK
ncbi:hypothetical protein BABINDRAFT_159540 [Babjeviella inositovora NRRL Y-12698]|uniref:phosphoserine transaminase n=1 Tax=Babjeviella inositovora NRRL Y-12698 TaxID=984486 RepID=A0A1E3QZH1_9ASCO|nr:uncharacterized protein BABINDRAFT_159540 [Babjeviella inositovora NRRL Y-12698]ODQ83079.1 hypothetical protein BABINDRAFT_159540 [Babjeviella inositovora NRRL Y-12698]